MLTPKYVIYNVKKAITPHAKAKNIWGDIYTDYLGGLFFLRKRAHF